MRNQLLESPVKTQDFIWVASYYDNTFLSEFNFDDQKENSFYDIDRNKLIRFGLVGYGMNLYFEVLGGVFKIAGRMIEVVYKVNDKNYYLTGQPLIMYNDIIQYKQAETTMNMLTGKTSNNVITQYNFGYKQNLNIDGINFNFKAICSVPYGKPVYMNFRLVADQDLNGILCIKKNGTYVAEISAPLQANVGGEVNWQVSV
jgi:hypothetical protein